MKQPFLFETLQFVDARLTFTVLRFWLQVEECLRGCRSRGGTAPMTWPFRYRARRPWTSHRGRPHRGTTVRASVQPPCWGFRGRSTRGEAAGTRVRCRRCSPRSRNRSRTRPRRIIKWSRPFQPSSLSTSPRNSVVSVREFDAAYRFTVSESSKCDCVEEKLFVLDNWMEHFVLKKEKNGIKQRNLSFWVSFCKLEFSCLVCKFE